MKGRSLVGETDQKLARPLLFTNLGPSTTTQTPHVLPIAPLGEPSPPKTFLTTQSQSLWGRCWASPATCWPFCECGRDGWPSKAGSSGVTWGKPDRDPSLCRPLLCASRVARAGAA